MKITTADKYFSLCVREQAKHTCLWCNQVKDSAQTSHVYSRRHRTIRWAKDNAKCLCFACHRKWHESPIESFKWYESVVGKEHIERLIEKRNANVKVSKNEEKEISKHYKQQYQLLLDGAKDFESYQ